MVWTLTCQPNCFQKQSTWGYYKHLYADEICCLCTSWRFGSYLYTILLASLGIALILADICRTVTNGPLPVCQARQDHSYNKWYLCPRLERDLSLMGSFLNLLIYIILLVGILAGNSLLLMPWLVCKMILIICLVPIWLVHLAFFHRFFTKWGLLTICFNVHNILQVICVSLSFE
ncbi:uncharacterized protein LOC124363791 [Homalodisca vitripennis]|uniref:uncharacterized protein LOC124363791 n=1 Tax=Homalodisca vitripennis TaxID=197043 RepID=UPI001EE9F8C9|nr:uncharacterized protein LOC124363791 [Homalodisca vitripennis]